MSNSALQTQSFSPGSPIKVEHLKETTVPLRSFDRLTIPKPCEADWDSMIGNDQVRFCEHCNLHVTDLSAMTRPAAMRLVARSRGRLCVRFIQRPDGGVLSRTVPEKLYRISRRVSRIAAGAFTATLSLSSAAAQAASESNLRASNEKAAIARTITQPESGISLSGSITDPNGALISGAALTLTNVRTAQAFSLTTADDGVYKFSLLKEGLYNLVVEAPSFARTGTEFELRPDVNQRLNISMEIPLIIAEVEITALPPTELFVQGGAAFVEPKEPLVKAAFKQELEALNQLAFSTPDLNVRDKNTRMTALEHAVENGNLEIVHTLLMAGAWANTQNSVGRTPLMYLHDNATDKLVHELLSAGAKVNARDESGETPLMNAASFSNYAVVRELIENGAKVDLKDDDGKSALMFAATNDDPRITKLLIEAGASVNIRDEDGKTALMMAAEEGDPQTVKVLISFNADINEKDDEGLTALMFAVGAGDVESVEALLNAGADVTFQNHEGKTALALARENDKDEIVKLLKSRGAPE
jgi:ankyrin repeat protein